MSDFTTSHYPRAKVPHKCVECRRTIDPGERYCRVSGTTDGRIWSEVLCLRCDCLNEAAWEHARITGTLDEDGPAFGNIAEWLLDDMGFTGALAMLTPATAGHFAGLVFRMHETAAETRARRTRVAIVERP